MNALKIEIERRTAKKKTPQPYKSADILNRLNRRKRKENCEILELELLNRASIHYIWAQHFTRYILRNTHSKDQMDARDSREEKKFNHDSMTRHLKNPNSTKNRNDWIGVFSLENYWYYINRFNEWSYFFFLFHCTFFTFRSYELSVARCGEHRWQRIGRAAKKEEGES